jgi:hypothetical protein
MEQAAVQASGPVRDLPRRQIGRDRIILVRQVAYEAESHGVSLQGTGKGWELSGSVLPDANGGNFSGDLISIVEQVLSETNVRLGEVIGTIDGTPFKPAVHPNQGETKWAFVERLARDRNVDLGTNPQGDLVLTGPHGPRMTAVLIEGENVKSAQIVIDGQNAYNYVLITGQRQPDDQTNGPAASELRSKAVPPGASPERLLGGPGLTGAKKPPYAARRRQAMSAV